MHDIKDIIIIFNHCFLDAYNTALVKGGDEPIYLPVDENRTHHELCFARGFYASALHEISHWLIAGEDRRKLVDFGYWYVPDGRDAEQQKLFQKVEIKPQALEWILSKAAGYRFFVSIDNLSGSEVDTESFKEAVYRQVVVYCSQGLPERAKILRESLCEFYHTSKELKIEDFVLRSL